jgi:hypothetical protein
MASGPIAVTMIAVTMIAVNVIVVATIGETMVDMTTRW